MTPVVNNKYDNLTAVVKTLDGFIVNHVPKAFTKPCRVMMQTVDVLAMNLQVSFIKLMVRRLKNGMENVIGRTSQSSGYNL